MMDNLTIDLKLLKKSGLCVENFVLLQSISEGIDPRELSWIFNVTLELEILEQQNYIKILDDSIEPRQKLLDIFQGTSLIKETEEVINYLNKEAESRFSSKSEANRKFIRARLNEGYTVDNLKAVIKVMTAAWKNSKYEDYLRPSTLFNAEKFQSYYNKSLKNINNNPINEMI